MPRYKLEELRYPQLDALDRQKTLFTIVISPIEEHGPHLPVGVDAFNAEYFAERLSDLFQLKYLEWNIVRIPSLYVGAHVFETVGSIAIRMRTIRNLLIDTLSSLAKYGFRYFLVSNAHGGPGHVIALEEAARYVSRKYKVRAISFSGKMIWEFLLGRFWPEICETLQMSEEERKALKDDAHGGQWETSMMLKLKPDLVDPSYKSLRSFSTKLITKLKPNYPLRLGEKLGYVGHPAFANEKLAELSSEFLLRKAFEGIEQDLFSEKTPGVSHFYRLYFYRTNFTLYAATIFLLIAVGLLWLFLK